MGNIVGENFQSYVIDQVKKRQEILGSINKTPEQLVWEYSKTSWVKLVSSVDIIDPTFLPKSITNSPGYQGGSTLAEKYVLFNGSTNEYPSGSINGISNLQRSGINSNGPFTNTGAYGIGGTDFGLQPMPGILSATIKTETRGTLKTGTVNIKANNKGQFEIISTLYLKLGYLVLLEWGNNCYYKNDGTFVPDNQASLADGFLIKKYNYNSILTAIEAKRQETNGNYDALVGKVVNFSWTFNKDGSYDIVIIIRSLGDVIESLKTNSLLPQTTQVSDNETKKSQQEDSPFDTIQSYAQRDSMARHFAKSLTAGESESSANGLTPYWYPPTFNGLKPPLYPYFYQEYANGVGSSGEKSLLSLDNCQFFIRFGEFLKLIEDFYIPEVEASGIKIISFDRDLQTNLIATHPKQIPSDPRICAFAKKVNYYGDYTFRSNENYLYYGVVSSVTINGSQTVDFSDNTEAFPLKSNPYVGKLMNVYFNMVYILELLEDLKDKNGKVPLIELLNTMLTGFQKTTGNYNNLSARVDTERNKIVFIDETPLPDSWKKTNITGNTVQFNVYGFETNNAGSIVGGSFIRDLQLKTEITPNMATMITIGSTADGYVTGQDATLLSSLNNGTQDRIKPSIISPSIGNRYSEQYNYNIDSVYTDAQVAFDTFVDTIAPSAFFLTGTTPNWNDDSYTNYTNTQVQLLEYEVKKGTIEQRKAGFQYSSSPTNGFIPFNLSLTMDGLSGMKIYQKYTIDSKFLPSNYPEAMEFIIKGVSNTIQNNIWTTNIESIAIPKSSTVKTTPIVSSTGSAAKPVLNQGISPQTSQYDSSVSPLRNEIVRIAESYKGVTENPIQDPGSVGFSASNFQNAIYSVGWRPGGGAEWCGWFTKLVWKQAYENVSGNYTGDITYKEGVKVIKTNTFKDFHPYSSPITANPGNTFTAMESIRFGPNNSIPGAERFIPGRTIIQKGDILIYDNGGHTGIAVEVNSSFITVIDGNFANKVSKYTYNAITGKSTISSNQITQVVRVVEPL
jgi:hypothetical protein